MIKMIVTAVLSIGLTAGGMMVAMPVPEPVSNGTFGSFDLTQNPDQKNEVTLSWTILGPTSDLEFYVYRGAEKIAELDGAETSYIHTESVYGIVRYTVAAFNKNTKQFLEDVYGLVYLGHLVWDPPTMPITGFTEGSPNIWSKYLTTEPDAVLFNGIEGNREAAVVDLDAEYDWYHDGVDMLSIYSIGDPAVLYIDPGIEYTNHDGFYVYVAEGPGDPYQLLPYGDPALYTYDSGMLTKTSLSELHSLDFLEGGKEYYFAVSTYLVVDPGLPTQEILISPLTEPVYLAQYSVVVAEPIYPLAPPRNLSIEF